MMQRFGCLVCLLLVSQTWACDLSHIQFYTEDNPPYSFMQNNQVQGTDADALLAIAALANCTLSRDQFSIQPWSRALRSAQQGPNSALFTIADTPERRPWFQWVGPVGEVEYHLIGKKSLARQQLPHGQLVYGAIINDLGERYLRQQSIDPDHLVLSVKPTNLAKLLAAGRIHYWAYNLEGAQRAMEWLGLNVDDYRSYQTFAREKFYIVFSKDVDPAVIERLQAASELYYQQNYPSTTLSH